MDELEGRGRLTRADHDFAPPGPELTPPPEEFPPPGSAQPLSAEPKRRRRLLRFLLAAAALVLAGWLFLRPGPAPDAGPGAPKAPLPAAAEEPASTPASTPAPTPAPTPSPTPEPTPEPTPTPVPTPTPPPWDVYPLADGEIHVTVYEDIFNDEYWISGEGEEGVLKLLETTIPEAEFTELALPYDEMPSYKPFVFVGFVLHFGNQFDQGFMPDAEPFVAVLGDTLTREDVERVPVSEDGVRYVNIHAMWRDEDELITDPSQYALALTLEDGMGGETLVEAKTPIFSEGYTYLAIFPEPEREGYTFTGWYDEDGNRVDYLTFFQFYDEIETEWGVDYDWLNPHSVVLTAGWEKNP